MHEVLKMSKRTKREDKIKGERRAPVRMARKRCRPEEALPPTAVEDELMHQHLCRQQQGRGCTMCGVGG